GGGKDVDIDIGVGVDGDEVGQPAGGEHTRGLLLARRVGRTGRVCGQRLGDTDPLFRLPPTRRRTPRPGTRDRHMQRGERVRVRIACVATAIPASLAIRMSLTRSSYGVTAMPTLPASPANGSCM